MSSFYSDMAAMAANLRSMQKQGFLMPASGVTSPELKLTALNQGTSHAPVHLSVLEKTNPAQEVHNRVATQGGGQLAASIRLCEQCERAKTRTKAVPGAGPEKVVYLVVADAPSAEDDMMGLPFVGSTGQFFDKWLDAIGLSRYTDTYLTTLVKCRGTGQALINQVEIEACGSWLKEQIRQMQPKGILVLGNAAVSWFAGTKCSVEDLRTQVQSYEGIPWLATFHPSEVMRNPDLKRPVWQDLKAFKALWLGAGH